MVQDGDVHKAILAPKPGEDADVLGDIEGLPLSANFRAELERVLGDASITPLVRVVSSVGRA